MEAVCGQPTLPYELYTHLIQFIPTTDKPTLAAVASSSRALHAVAQNILYDSVSFDCLDFTRLLLFLDVLARNAETASLVTSLTLPLSMFPPRSTSRGDGTSTTSTSGSSIVPPDLQRILSDALAKCVNLKELAFSEPPVPDAYAEALGWGNIYSAMSNAPFRLRRFNDNYKKGDFLPVGYFGFFYNQPGIEEWSFRSTFPSEWAQNMLASGMPEWFAPRLRVVSVEHTEVLRLLVGRSIERLFVALSPYDDLEDVAQTVRHFRSSLRHLCLDGMMADRVNTASDFFSLVAASAPEIQSLSLLFRQHPRKYTLFDYAQIPSCLGLFKHLRAAVIDLSGCSSTLVEIMDEADYQSLAELCFALSPSLCRIALTCNRNNSVLKEDGSSSSGSVQNASTAHSNRWICYQRGPNGYSAVLQGHALVDEESWKTMDV